MEKPNFRNVIHRALTKADIEAMINEWSDEEAEIASIVIVPPEKVDENTDEEDLDDDIVPNQDFNKIKECVGTFEINTNEMTSEDQLDELHNIESSQASDIDLVTSSTSSGEAHSSKRRRIEIPQNQQQVYKSLQAFGKPKWTQRNNRERQFHFDIEPNSEELESMQSDLVDGLKNKMPFELFCLFFDDEVFTMIIEETNRYSQQKNENFCLDAVNLKRFLGILVLSGYHVLPTVRDYWSNHPTLGLPIVKLCMPRNQFLNIQRYIHFCNNYNLDENDKMAKVRPLYEIINRKFMQFGIFEKELSIDEQMVPYFGRHSCKIFIRGKPIRFGYKLWCLCSASGFLYFCIPYAGSSDNYKKQIGLGADVVLRLVDNIKFPNRHILFFDNFFTSYYLMCLLTEKRLRAIRTVRANRIRGAELKTGKQLEKGNHDFQFDTKNKILICRWQDNSEVTIATNFDQIVPTVPVKRWKKAKKNKDGKIIEPGHFKNYNQPQMIKNYNQGMGGVDLHDNAVQNYSIAIKSKKWYWPLWISVLNSALVNAWKLDCFLRRYKKTNILPQKDFRIDIAYALMMTPDEEESHSEGDDNSIESEHLPHLNPQNLPNIRGNHLIIKIENNKKRRCKHCHKPASFLCRRCNIPLHTHCFETYHNENGYK